MLFIYYSGAKNEFQMEFCLEEWCTGVFVKTKFDESSISKIYETHLKGVTDWQKGNPSIVDGSFSIVLCKLAKSLSTIQTDLAGVL